MSGSWRSFYMQIFSLCYFHYFKYLYDLILTRWTIYSQAYHNICKSCVNHMRQEQLNNWKEASTGNYIRSWMVGRKNNNSVTLQSLKQPPDLFLLHTNIGHFCFYHFLENKAHTQDWSATAIIISFNAHMWWFYSTIAWFHMIYWKQHLWTSFSCGTEWKTEPLTAHVTLHLNDLSLANAGFLRPMFGDLKSQYFGTGQHFVFLFRYMKHIPDICWLVIYSFMLCLTALRTAACCFCCVQRCCKQEGCRVPSGGQISTYSKGVSPISHLIFICQQL